MPPIDATRSPSREVDRGRSPAILAPTRRADGHRPARVEVSDPKLDPEAAAIAGADVVRHPARLRDLERARLALDRPSPAPRPGYPPATCHPWRRATPGSALEAIRRSEERARDDDD